MIVALATARHHRIRGHREHGRRSQRICGRSAGRLRRSSRFQITQIYEGTHQVQRMAMARQLLNSHPGPHFRKSVTTLAGHAVAGQIPCGGRCGPVHLHPRSTTASSRTRDEITIRRLLPVLPDQPIESPLLVRRSEPNTCILTLLPAKLNRHQLNLVQACDSCYRSVLGHPSKYGANTAVADRNPGWYADRNSTCVAARDDTHCSESLDTRLSWFGSVRAVR